MAEAATTRYYYGLGRRKTSIAKVRLLKGKGQITINNKPADSYFNHSQPLLAELISPLVLVNKADSYDLNVVIKGGGHHSQVGAIKLGIAKALIESNNDFKDTLKRNHFLSRDPRAKERKKFGLKGARKKRQFTKR